VEQNICKEIPEEDDAKASSLILAKWSNDEWAGVNPA
jgi:hypothetical protein